MLRSLINHWKPSTSGTTLYRPLSDDGSFNAETKSVSRRLLPGSLMSFYYGAIASLAVVGVFVIFFYILNSLSTPSPFVPEMPLIPVKFERFEEFAGPSSPENDAAWDALMPVGRGFVLIENPDAFHLKPGIPTKVGPDRYSISMFHQLHCLGMIRQGYYAGLHGHRGFAHADANLDEETRLREHEKHTGHCFDYLRQAIMCAGDMTLEWAKVETNGIRITVDGWGVEHQCRDWGRMVEFVEEHHAPNNYTGIL